MTLGSTTLAAATEGALPKARVWRVLVDGDGTLATRLALEIAGTHSVAVSRSSSCSLIMALARDTVSNQPFCLGEVLVTECTATVNGHPGYGIVTGERPDLAYALAVLDAAWAAGLPEVAGWRERLLAEEKAIAAARRSEFAVLERSRVRFETMEDYK